MTDGAVFDTMADEYDRHRPSYPDELVNRACEIAGLTAGDRVLEIGCGTGQLTRSLTARGLRVTAVEPGANLVALAERTSAGPGEADFLNCRFEDAELAGHFGAVFSAAAFHWVDPDVSWRKAAQSLAPGGVLALIQHGGVHDELTAPDSDALISALAVAAPEMAESWPPLRDLETIVSGAEERRGNIADVWAWVWGQAVARGYAARLFEDAEISAVPLLIERTADELNELFRTMSVYHRLAPAQQRALERATAQVEEQLGRPIRSSLVVVLVTARRAP